MGSDRISLAVELTKVRPLSDAGTRDLLIQMISNTIGHPLNPRAHADGRLHLYNIVDACAEQSGGLMALARSVDFIQPGSQASATIRKWTVPQAGNHVSAESEQHIEAMLGNVMVPRTAKLFQLAVGAAWEPGAAIPNEPKEAFRLLLDINSKSGELPRHLWFVEAVAESLRGTLQEQKAAELRGWVDEELRAFEEADRTLLLDRLAEFRGLSALQVTDRQSDSSAYLVIALEPYEQPGNLYRIAHWIDAGSGVWSPGQGEDQKATLIEAPTRIAELIRSVEGTGLYEHPGSLQVEFVLPLHLMNLEVDQWLADPPEEPVPRSIGMRYRTVIRNLERLRRGDLHRDWRERWRRVRNSSDIAKWPLEGMHWVAIDKSANLALLEQAVSDEEIVCCAFTHPPDGDDGQDALWVVLRGGISVVLWCREGDHAAEFQQTITRIVDDGLLDLPDKVQGVRRRVTELNAAIGRHITLIWDDFDRSLGIGVPMTPPQLKG